MFSTDEHVKKAQIASFFSRFAAQCKKRTDANEDTNEKENDVIDPSNRHDGVENTDDSLEEDDYGVQDDEIGNIDHYTEELDEVSEEQDELDRHLSFLRNVKELYDDSPNNSALVSSNHNNDNKTDVSQREKEVTPSDVLDPFSGRLLKI